MTTIKKTSLRSHNTRVKMPSQDLFEDRGVEDEIDDPDLVIIRPFDPERIKVNTIPAIVSLLVRRIEENEIDLAPEFQRRARVWDKGRKSRLIESLLLRIPLPVFYVAADSKDRWSVVDGLQRLTTIYDFAKDKFELQGLEYLTQLKGLNFTSLPRSFQRRIEETSLVVNLIQDGTPEEVMINIFKRINTGGVSLTGQEIRNALNKGPVRDFLRDLAKCDEFIAATAKSVSDDRMDAQECVLRFMAFYLKPWPEYVKESPGLDLFLNQAMRSISEFSVTKRNKLARAFKAAMMTAHEIFGNDAFRKRYSKDDSRKMINKALFEAWSVNIALFSAAEQKVFAQKKARLLSGFIQLMNTPEFDTAISSSTGTSTRVEIRFAKINKLLQSVL
ncbi:DUF262 domain-containing protein [Massilia sp. YMA4]|uniref:DUF262 domain-containing protein n=1 Tax=Massilia sp. YMA4 TaxID=1593482 RepID=UPI000DD1425C|nr:DUF262 domain-containing protein [Massilia sp. YMA4]AXA94020.1 DUF262 domain-containing protein [Massilia sp. YMA4]